MLNRLFSAFHPPEPPRQALRGIVGFYAIGDIHGSLMPLRLLHDQIRKHAESRPIVRKCLVYLGDYVDRGTDSPAVLDLLISRPFADFEYIFLKGNHEKSLCGF